MKWTFKAHNWGMPRTKVYTVTLKFLMDQKPTEKRIDINEYRGRVVKVRRDDETGKYQVDVLFNVTSMVGLMAATDDSVMSKTIH